MSFENLCKCPINAPSEQQAKDDDMRQKLTRVRQLELREIVVTNVYQRFVTSMFANKSAPYAKRFE